MTDKAHLLWLHKRLEAVHGENPRCDYMIRFKEIIDSMSCDFESLLKADIEETLRNHYNYTEKEIKQFIHIHLEALVEESYQAQTEQLLNKVNGAK